MSTAPQPATTAVRDRSRRPRAVRLVRRPRPVVAGFEIVGLVALVAIGTALAAAGVAVGLIVLASAAGL